MPTAFVIVASGPSGICVSIDLAGDAVRAGGGGRQHIAFTFSRQRAAVGAQPHANGDHQRHDQHRSGRQFVHGDHHGDDEPEEKRCQNVKDFICRAPPATISHCRRLAGGAWQDNVKDFISPLPACNDIVHCRRLAGGAWQIKSNVKDFICRAPPATTSCTAGGLRAEHGR